MQMNHRKLTGPRNVTDVDKLKRKKDDLKKKITNMFTIYKHIWQLYW